LLQRQQISTFKDGTLHFNYLDERQRRAAACRHGHGRAPAPARRSGARSEGERREEPPLYRGIRVAVRAGRCRHVAAGRGDRGPGAVAQRPARLPFWAFPLRIAVNRALKRVERRLQSAPAKKVEARAPELGAQPAVREAARSNEATSNGHGHLPAAGPDARPRKKKKPESNPPADHARVERA